VAHNGNRRLRDDVYAGVIVVLLVGIGTIAADMRTKIAVYVTDYTAFKEYTTNTRFTAAEGALLNRSIQHTLTEINDLKTEDKRLQVQIDQLQRLVFKESEEIPPVGPYTKDPRQFIPEWHDFPLAGTWRW
jgi:hypothetical protein